MFFEKTKNFKNSFFCFAFFKKNTKQKNEIIYYRALPRGNTSSGNTKRSCGWS